MGKKKKKINKKLTQPQVPQQAAMPKNITPIDEKKMDSITVNPTSTSRKEVEKKIPLTAPATNTQQNKESLSGDDKRKSLNMEFLKFVSVRDHYQNEFRDKNPNLNIFKDFET